VGEKLRIILQHYLPHLLTDEGDIIPNLDSNSIENGLQKMIDTKPTSGFKPQSLDTSLTPSEEDSKPIKLIHHIKFGDQKFFNALKNHGYERASGLTQSGKIKFGDQKFFKAQQELKLKRAKDAWLRTLTHNLAEEPRGRRRMYKDEFDSPEPPLVVKSQIQYSKKIKPVLTHRATEKLYRESPKPLVLRSKNWDMVLPSYFQLSHPMSRAQRRRDKRHYRNSEKFRQPSYLRSQKISSSQDADMWRVWQSLTSKRLLERKNALKY